MSSSSSSSRSGSPPPRLDPVQNQADSDAQVAPYRVFPDDLYPLPFANYDYLEGNRDVVKTHVQDVIRCFETTLDPKNHPVDLVIDSNDPVVRTHSQIRARFKELWSQNKTRREEGDYTWLHSTFRVSSSSEFRPHPRVGLPNPYLQRI